MNDSLTEKLERRAMPMWMIVAFWVGAIAIAMSLDSTVANSIAQRAPKSQPGILDKDGTIASIIRSPGVFYFTLVIAAILTLVHPWKWRAGGLLVLAGAVGGLGYHLIKWLTGRMRPEYRTPYEFDLFKGGLRSIYDSPAGLSFPSGHTTLAFVTASVLALCYPRFRWVFYALASIVAIGRVMENTHYVSDVVAAAGLGILSRDLTVKLTQLFMSSPAPAEPSRSAAGRDPREPEHAR